MGRTLYVSQQDCYLSLNQELLVVKRAGTILQQAQIPHLDQILIFGHAQVTTQLIQSCLQRNIPIAYLSRMGYCYGRLQPIQRGNRALQDMQMQLTSKRKLETARQILKAKVHNSRILLLRQRRRKPQVSGEKLALLQRLHSDMNSAQSIEQLMGLEGAAAASYYPTLGECLTHLGFELTTRSRRPPRDPVNAMLSFGYQLLWNHILLLIELQGLDPYQGCLHTSHHNHPCLASDLIEEFRAPIIDSLVLWLINTGVMDPFEDFTDEVEGCLLTQSGRTKFLQAFIQRMEDTVQPPKDSVTGTEEDIPRWALVNHQVQIYRQFVGNQLPFYTPYLIR
ncbi:MAG: CRISPR-associated endonuclease Cas1 [Cyanobacteriota bacterium]|nr:CRISPR-associated endonuclease Cas1 [Cyanobacteriota bacterium]